MTVPAVPSGPLVPLPAQPVGVPWPTSAWPTGDVPDGVDLGPLLDAAFDPEGDLHDTYAMLVVHRGRLVAQGTMDELRAAVGGAHATLEDVFLELTRPAERAA